MVSQGYTRSEYDHFLYFRLVTKGYSHIKVIDYDDIFSPVFKLVSIRIVLALVALLDLELEQLDVKINFLHGDWEEEIYMEQP